MLKGKTKLLLLEQVNGQVECSTHWINKYLSYRGPGVTMVNKTKGLPYEFHILVGEADSKWVQVNKFYSCKQGGGLTEVDCVLDKLTATGQSEELEFKPDLNSMEEWVMQRSPGRF